MSLDIEQLISHHKSCPCWYYCLSTDSEVGGISVSEVCELPIKVHDILANAVSKRAGNSVHILVHVFNSASRKHHGIWASQFSFLYGPKDTVPPVRLDCMAVWTGLGHRLINSPPQTGFHFSVQMRPVPVSSGAFLAKGPHLESKIETSRWQEVCWW